MYFLDRDQHVRAWPDLGVARDELASTTAVASCILTRPPCGMRCARVIRHVDENPLDPLGVDIDLETARGLRQQQRDVIAEHPLQDRRHVAQRARQVDRLDVADLLVSIDDELPQEAGGAPDVAEQQLALLPQPRVASNAASHCRPP